MADHAAYLDVEFVGLEGDRAPFSGALGPPLDQAAELSGLLADVVAAAEVEFTAQIEASLAGLRTEVRS